jgi:adenylate cyclase
MPPQRNKSRLHQTFSWRTFLTGLSVATIVFSLLVTFPNALSFLDLKISDLRMAARGARPPTNRVIVVAIDQKSIAELGHWPWPRNLMAQLQDALASYHPKVIGYDLLFSEADTDITERAEISSRLRQLGFRETQLNQTLGLDNDEKFAAAIKRQGNTFLGYAFAEVRMHRRIITPAPGYLNKAIDPPPMSYQLIFRAPHSSAEILHARAYLPPIPVLNSSARGTGFYDVDADADGEIRGELTVIRFHDRMCVPFFLAVAQAFEDDQPLRLNIDSVGIRTVNLGETVIPVDEMGNMLVTFRSAAGGFPHVSAVDVLRHRVAAVELAGKAVLVGATAQAIGDRAVTPAGAEFPRVEIHANAIDDVFGRDFVNRSKLLTLDIERLWAVALGVGISAAVAYLTAPVAFATVLALIGAYVGYAQYELVYEGILLGIVFPVAVGLGTSSVLAIYRYWTEGLEKRRLRHAFEHYLHPDVIAAVVDNPDGLKLGGERKIITILFADIVNYTGLSERTDPAALVALLNDYMTKMTDLILESGGVVDKIRGDGIMAFWGAPLEIPNHARAAIDSALAMLSELKILRERDPRFADIDIGIGIATGEAIAGNFGGARRFDYSVIGDTVNLASRLEGLTRQFKVHLLVSKESFSAAARQYVARDIGLVRVKGKTLPVPIMEVVAAAGDGADSSYYDRFAEVLDGLRSGATEAASKALEAMRAERPDDGVIALYLDKLTELAGTPAGELVFEFDTK